MVKSTLLLLVLSIQQVFACGLFFSNDFLETPLSINREETLILFDQDKNEQQFIRKIHIEGAPPKFGFLVPVPSKPSVDEIKQDVFSALKDEYEKQREVVHRFTLFGEGNVNQSDRDGMLGGMSKGRGGHPGSVEIIEQKKLGSFQVSILKAEDGEGLKKWIDENAYKTETEMFDYLDSYVKKKFFFVVFNFLGNFSGDNDVSSQTTQTSQTIRLTFKVNEAFYPFKEPKYKNFDQLTGLDIYSRERDFRLSIIQKGVGTPNLIGHKELPAEDSSVEAMMINSFRGSFNLRFASTIKHTHEMWKSLGFSTESATHVLTQYQYLHKYRPAYDLSFGSSQRYDQVLPPEKIVWHPLGLYLLVLFVLGIFCVYRFRKKKNCCA